MPPARRLSGGPSSLPTASPSRPSLPIRALLAANLAAQSTLLPQLFTLTASLSTPASSSSSARTQTAIARIYSQLAALDEELAQLTERARQHAAKWERMESLKRECILVEGEVRQRAMRLERGRRELEKLVKEARKTTEGIELARNHPLPPADLLSYAATLAPYTSAPPSFDPATTPHSGPGAFFPPFPTEHSMRRGRLNAGGELGVVGQTSEVQDLPRPEKSTAAEPFVHALIQRPQPTAEVFDFDLNSDLDD